MQRLLFPTAALLLGCNASLAQASTMGSTAMGLSSTPGTIVTSPLNGPGPFSATTQPGTPVTTLAPVPMASDPTTPGTVVSCSTPTGQITPGTPAVPVNSLSATSGTTGTTPSTSAAATIPTVPATSPTSTTASASAPLLLSATPAPTLSTIPNTVSTSPAGSTATMTPSTTTMSSTAMMSSTPLGTIPHA